MPKRKAPCSSDTQLSVSSLDAAFDILASETFSKLDHLVKKFEAATHTRLNDGVAHGRWDEACKRYWVTKAMEDLCCSGKPTASLSDMAEAMDTNDEGRPLPPSIYPGPANRHKLSSGEEMEWRKWSPKVGDLVLVDTPDDQLWPAKIIERRAFYQGRTVPRGNHFFPVRIYSEEIEPSVTVKSRMIPFDIRPDPPLLASISVINAYNHARHPSSFDRSAEQREQAAARARTHPGALAPGVPVRADKDAWNAHVNWVMNERRVEKLRNLNEEREKKLHAISSDISRKRNCYGGFEGEDLVETVPQLTPPRSLNAMPLFRPATQPTPRPMSPRRLEKRRNGIYAGIGEYSPRARGSTYTPPRILSSGDETAPSTSPSPVPSSLRFDFVSPLGPVRGGRLDERPVPRRSGSLSGLALEAVEEEVLEDDGEWQVVQRRAGRRSSAPCQDVPPRMEVEVA